VGRKCKYEKTTLYKYSSSGRLLREVSIVDVYRYLDSVSGSCYRSMVLSRHNCFGLRELPRFRAKAAIRTGHLDIVNLEKMIDETLG